MADSDKKKKKGFFSIFSALSKIDRPPDSDSDAEKSQVEKDREAARKRGRDRRK